MGYKTYENITYAAEGDTGNFGKRSSFIRTLLNVKHYAF